MARDREARRRHLASCSSSSPTSPDAETSADLEREADALGRSSSASARCSCSPASTTPRTPSSRSAPVPAAPRPPTGPTCCCGCTCAGRSATGSRPTSWTRRRASRRASRARPSTVDGRFAYGWLRAERGVHRLVRISPYDAQKRRQTTFALVEVMPEADEDVEIELNWDEIRVDTFRSSGAGGQHVQKTESAIRLTHLPTGIVVTCQNERSATQNRELAIRVLKSRLLELELEKREEELRKLRGEHVDGGLGQPDPVLRPPPLPDGQGPAVRLRDSNTGAVLDGDLDAFMQAELERLATGPPARAATTATTTVTRWPRRRAAAGVGYRPGAADDLDACMRDLAGGDRGLPGPPRTSRRCRTTSRRSAGCSRTCWRPTRTASGSPSRRRRRRCRAASRRACVRARGAVVPRDAVRATGPRATGSAGADGPRPGGSRRGPGRRRRSRPGRAVGQRHPHVGHVHRRRPADLERPLRAARDGAADPGLAAVRRGPSLVRRCPHAAAGPRGGAVRAARDGRPEGQRRLAGVLDDLDRELIGAAHPADHAFLRREGRERVPRPARRAAASSATSTARPVGRLGPVAALDPALHPALLGVAVRETPMLGRGRAVGPGHGGLATRALLDAGPAPRRVPGAHLLVAPGAPVRPLRADLARAGLTAPARHAVQPEGRGHRRARGRKRRTAWPDR